MKRGGEVVKPQYRIVDDYKFGFAQVDVDGKSGLIDRDGKMVIEPKYGYRSDRSRSLSRVGPSAAWWNDGWREFFRRPDRVHRVGQRQRFWNTLRI